MVEPTVPEPINVEEAFETQFLSRRRLIWRSFRKHRLGVVSMWILIIFYLIAIFADFLAPSNPYRQDLPRSFSSPSRVHWFYDGQFVGPYVLGITSYRDPNTRVRIYEDAGELLHVQGYDQNDQPYSLTVGADGISAIRVVIRTDEVARGPEGDFLIRSTTREESMIPVARSEMLTTSTIREVTAPDILSMTTSNPRYTRQLAQIGGLQLIEHEESVERLIIVREDGMQDIQIATVEDYLFKRYPIRFFVRGWEYKWLGFIPGDIHLFGVEAPAQLFLFGADSFGRDVFSRILFGSRISLSVGLIGILITFTIGLFLGGFSGFYGGWIDEGMMRLTEILMSIPGLYLLIALRSVLPPELPSTVTYLLIVVILSFIGWPGMSRVIRGMVLSLKQREFVEAAKAMGYPPRRIIWKHIIPNTATYIIVSATLSIPGYILGEAGLSFLGFGIREPQASWGLMLSQAQNLTALQNYPWLLIPGAFLFFAILAFNLFGDAIRDAFDPRSLGQ